MNQVSGKLSALADRMMNGAAAADSAGSPFQTGGHGLVPTPKAKGAKLPVPPRRVGTSAVAEAQKAAAEKPAKPAAPAPAPHPLDVPDCLKVSPEERAATRNMPLPRSAPGRDMAIPEAKKASPKTPQTKSEAEARAKELGLSLKAKGKIMSKSATAKKPAKTSPSKAAAVQPAGERARYDWTGAEAKAEKGTVPTAPDFSAPTHERFRPLMAEVVKAAKAGDADALRKIKINPISSSPKAVKRYRDICLKALKAKAA